MITKSDLILLLTELEESGDSEAHDYIIRTLNHPSISPEVLSFIDKRRGLDITNFYERLRNNYNKKRSALYKNIVRSDEETPRDIITTLSALSLQIALFASKLDNPEMFLRHARAREINIALAKYYTDYSLESCNKLLRLCKADLKILEEVREK